jgi:hypothetical protein
MSFIYNKDKPIKIGNKNDKQIVDNKIYNYDEILETVPHIFMSLVNDQDIFKIETMFGDMYGSFNIINDEFGEYIVFMPMKKPESEDKITKISPAFDFIYKMIYYDRENKFLCKLCGLIFKVIYFDKEIIKSRYVWLNMPELRKIPIKTKDIVLEYNDFKYKELQIYGRVVNGSIIRFKKNKEEFVMYINYNNNLNNDLYLENHVKYINKVINDNISKWDSVIRMFMNYIEEDKELEKLIVPTICNGIIMSDDKLYNFLSNKSSVIINGGAAYRTYSRFFSKYFSNLRSIDDFAPATSDWDINILVHNFDNPRIIDSILSKIIKLADKILSLSTINNYLELITFTTDNKFINIKDKIIIELIDNIEKYGTFTFKIVICYKHNNIYWNKSIVDVIIRTRDDTIFGGPFQIYKIDGINVFDPITLLNQSIKAIMNRYDKNIIKYKKDIGRVNYMCYVFSKLEKSVLDFLNPQKDKDSDILLKCKRTVSTLDKLTKMKDIIEKEDIYKKLQEEINMYYY